MFQTFYMCHVIFITLQINKIKNLPVQVYKDKKQNSCAHCL
jgi:hypothetical protein